MNKATFSIIIPAFNDEKFIEECLESVTTQGINDIEAIVINDGSTDGTEAIARKFLKYPNFKLINNEKNMKLSTTRNRGLDAARGEYIVCLDSDDYLEPNGLEIPVKHVGVSFWSRL